MKEKIVLIHGYNKNGKDMNVLKNHLEKLGYEGVVIDLPLTFKEIEYGVEVLNRKMEEVFKGLKDKEKIHFVGHSTGGLAIRKWLRTTEHIHRVGRCVFVATPNRGSELADIAGKISGRFVEVFKTLKSLQCQGVRGLELENGEQIEMGAIAGNRKHLFLGNLLAGENDGRVTVQSVQFPGLKDFIVLPYGHKEIHYQVETAEMIHRFIQKGTFHLSS